MDIKEIMAIIPHRSPFLLVDRIISLEPGKKAIGIKNVTVNEPFFQGHFPEFPVMPGVLIVEALAQVGAVALLSLKDFEGKIALFAGIDNVRFRQQVFPGDQLKLEVELLKIKGRLGKGKGTATVGDKVAAEGEFLFAMTDAK